MVRYNAALAASPDERRVLLAERLASVGAGAVIRPPFHCDYGYNIHLGEGAFLNFNCVILDVVEVHIGAGAQIGPAVQFTPPTIHVTPRRVVRAWSSVGRSISVATSGRWRGDHPPGVTVGDDAVIGAGSVVTRDGWRHRGRQPGAGVS